RIGLEVDHKSLKDPHEDRVRSSSAQADPGPQTACRVPKLVIRMPSVATPATIREKDSPYGAFLESRYQASRRSRRFATPSSIGVSALMWPPPSGPGRS